MSDPIGQVSNVPGFEYMTSIATAWIRALQQQASEYSTIWTKIREGGEYGFKDYLKANAATLETTFGFLRDIARGPFPQDAPDWAYFVFQKGNPTGFVASQTRPLSRRFDPSADLQVGPLVALKSTPANLPMPDLSASWAGKGGDAVVLQFDDRAVKVLSGRDPGEYIGFVYPSQSANGAPILIVMLRITD